MLSIFSDSLSWVFHSLLNDSENNIPHSAKIKLSQFALDDTQKCLKLIRYDPEKLDSPPAYQARIEKNGTHVIQNTKTYMKDGEKFLYNGQRFKNSCAFDSHISKISNHYLFTFLQHTKYSPTEVPILIIDDHIDCDSEFISCGMLDKYPNFLISISNDSQLQKVATRAIVNIKEVIPVLSAGKSEKLYPIAQYYVKISDTKGKYSKDLVPPIKIAANDSASINIKVIPKKISGFPTGKVLIASIMIYFDNYELIETPNFMFPFMN